MFLLDVRGGDTVEATASLAFTQGTITVHPNDAVTFTFDAVAHNVFFDVQPGAPANIEGQESR